MNKRSVRSGGALVGDSGADRMELVEAGGCHLCKVFLHTNLGVEHVEVTITSHVN